MTVNHALAGYIVASIIHVNAYKGIMCIIHSSDIILQLQIFNIIHCTRGIIIISYMTIKFIDLITMT